MKKIVINMCERYNILNNYLLLPYDYVTDIININCKVVRFNEKLYSLIDLVKEASVLFLFYISR